MRIQTITQLLALTFLLPLAIHARSTGDTLNIERFITEKKVSAKRLREGVFLTVHTEGGGKTPKQGDFVRVHYVGKLLDGRIFDCTPKKEPFAFQLGNSQVVQGLDIALANLPIGTKATVFLDAPMAYGQLGIGDVIPPNTPIFYEIEVVELISKDQYEGVVQDLQDKMRHDFIERMAAQFELDKKQIQEYALIHRIRTKRTENGISYAVTKQGSDSITANSRVSLLFEAKLLNDKVYDSTKERGIYEIKMDENAVIAGLEEGLKYFTKGSEGYILIPSKYGYGAFPIDDGNLIVPSNSVLIFKIQIVDVKPAEAKVN